jgi:four helix bundle protein
MKENISLIKSKALAIRVINLYKFLCNEKHEYVLSKQLLRSGTAIGALLREAEHAQSKADFLNKTNVALKEANELCYWLELLVETDIINQQEFDSINTDATEMLKLLIAIVKTTKGSLGR